MLNYFSESEDWLGALMAGLGDGFEREKMKFNFRMISYQGGSGTCQPHRDFGLLTLIQQNGVSGLKVEQEGRLVDIPATCSLLSKNGTSIALQSSAAEIPPVEGSCGGKLWRESGEAD